MLLRLLTYSTVSMLLCFYFTSIKDMYKYVIAHLYRKPSIFALRVPVIKNQLSSHTCTSIYFILIIMFDCFHFLVCFHYVWCDLLIYLSIYLSIYRLCLCQYSFDRLCLMKVFCVSFDHLWGSGCLCDVWQSLTYLMSQDFISKQWHTID